MAELDLESSHAFEDGHIYNDGLVMSEFGYYYNHIHDNEYRSPWTFLFDKCYHIMIFILKILLVIVIVFLVQQWLRNYHQF